MDLKFWVVYRTRIHHVLSNAHHSTSGRRLQYDVSRSVVSWNWGTLRSLEQPVRQGHVCGGITLLGTKNEHESCPSVVS